MIFARAIFWPDDVNQDNVREDTVFFLWNWGGSKPALFSTRGGAQLFLARKKTTSCRFYFIYTSKATSQVNLGYLQDI